MSSSDVSEKKAFIVVLLRFDTEHVFELTVPSLPFLKLKCLFGHVSFPGALPNGGLWFSHKASVLSEN